MPMNAFRQNPSTGYPVFEAALLHFDLDGVTWPLSSCVCFLKVARPQMTEYMVRTGAGDFIWLSHRNETMPRHSCVRRLSASEARGILAAYGEHETIREYDDVFLSC